MNADEDIITANRKLEMSLRSLERARHRLAVALAPGTQHRTTEQVEKIQRAVRNAEAAYEKARQRSRTLIGSGSGAVVLKWPDFVEGRSG